MQSTADASRSESAQILASLAHPRPALLAGMLEARANLELNPEYLAPLPPGIKLDLRPKLPKVGHNSMMLYAHRKVVDSYPLIYTTLALAHPN